MKDKTITRFNFLPWVIIGLLAGMLIEFLILKNSINKIEIENKTLITKAQLADRFMYPCRSEGFSDEECIKIANNVFDEENIP